MYENKEDKKLYVSVRPYPCVTWKETAYEGVDRWQYEQTLTFRKVYTDMSDRDSKQGSEREFGREWVKNQDG